MKLLCLGDIRSFASLQDALFGKGLPPIQCEAVEESSEQHNPCGSQYDWILIRNSEPVETRRNELGKVIRQLQFSNCISVSLPHNEDYNSPATLLGHEQETVVFEYHSPCAAPLKHGASTHQSFHDKPEQNNTRQG